MAARSPAAPAGPARERRPAIWPWLLMPLIVLLVFCALYRVHKPAHRAAVAPPTHTADTSGTGTPRQ